MSIHSAFVLSGGGARGAYQAGVSRALYELARQHKKLDIFKNLVGVSAGAINASALAAGADDLDASTNHLCNIWTNLHAEQVFRTDSYYVSRNALRLIRGLSLGGVSDQFTPSGPSLLNNSPLRRLLTEKISFDRISDQIQSRNLRSIAVSATDYSTGVGVTLFESSENIDPWRRSHRIGRPEKITVDHILASSAIPLFFPPNKVNGVYFGDGCLRNTAPLSPAIRLGARNILVVGVKHQSPTMVEQLAPKAPSLGKILGAVINAAFFDAIEPDLERLRLLNHLLKHVSQETVGSNKINWVNTLYLKPSEDLAQLANDHAKELPRLIRFLFGGLGKSADSSDLLSYILFQPKYCGRLVELGYEDTMNRKNEVEAFFNFDHDTLTR